MIEVIKNIWLKANLPCSKRLKPILKLWLPVYSEEFGITTSEIISKINTISPATLDRILKSVKVKYRGNSGETSPLNYC